MRQKLRKILVTGGAGFIGSAFVRQAVTKGQKIIVVDNLSYAGDLKRLQSVVKKFKFYKTNIANAKALKAVFQKEKPHTVIHFAAETHVDRSISGAEAFIKTNVTGTQNCIDCARLTGVKRFIHISTDEVYGDSTGGWFKETDPIQPNNPYSATKAAAEFLVRAAIRTFKFPAIVIRPSNNYGPWQYPEKFIPVIISKALSGQRIPVYGKGAQIREWLYVEDCAQAVDVIAKKGKVGETYNIGTKFECSNLTTAKTILKLLKKPEPLIKFVKDRPGHDFRYSVNYQKLSKLGWRPRTPFKKGIQQTIQWYVQNQDWVKKKRA